MTSLSIYQLTTATCAGNQLTKKTKRKWRLPASKGSSKKAQSSISRATEFRT